MNIDYSSKKTGTPNGANIAIQLSFNPRSSELTTKIEAFTAEGVRFPPVIQTQDIQSVDQVEVDACGADGKPGVQGKDGQHGLWGIDGRPANEYSAGTDGGRGYPGEDGTPGTSGGPGGDAGHVVINVGEKDTDLLGIVHVANKGGAGGPAGRHGIGGQGGRGGRGGSSYSWRTRKTVPVDVRRLVTESVYDPNHYQCPYSGHRTGDYIQKTEYKTVTEYQTKYENHTNPGGRDGSPGAAGHTPTTPLYNGKPGKDGTLSIHVSTSKGNLTFPGIYNLSLVSFKAEPLAQNGIFEPGSTIEVSDIVIKNTGLMPTPAQKKIKIRVSAGDYATDSQQELYLLSSVEPGQEVRIKGTMRFVINECKGHQGAPYSEQKRLDLAADLTRLKKQLAHFSKPQLLQLKHPIEVDAVEAPASILPGEVAKISLVVCNRSSKDIGAKSLFAMCKRAIYASIALSPEASRQGLRFCDALGTPSTMPRCEAELPVINAGGKVRVSWYVTLSGAAEERRTHRVTTALDLEKIGTPGEMKRIEGRTVEISEGIGYQPKSNNDFLLVTNGATTPAELNAWKTLAADLGLSIAVWDLSVYHHLFLSRTLATPSKSTLLKDWQNKLIVVLNKMVNSQNHYPIMPFDRIPSADLDKALREYQSKLYVFGAPYPEDVRPSIAQPSPKAGCREFTSAHEAIRSYRDFPPDVGTYNFVHVETWLPPFSNETDHIFSKALESITSHFKKKFPRELITISPVSDVTILKEIPLTGVKKVSLGYITIRREEIAAEGDILSGQVNASEMSAPSTITSFSNKVLVLAAMPTRALAIKAVLELKKPTPSKHVATALARALFYNAARDVEILLSEDAAATKSGIPTLFALAKTFNAIIDPRSLPSGQAWATLMGTLSCLKAHYAPWHKRYIPWSTSREIAKKIDSHMKEMQAHLSKVAGADAMNRYRNLQASAHEEFWKLRPTTEGESTKEWVLTDPVGSSSSSTIKPRWVNPYLVESDASMGSYNSLEKNICDLVEKELSNRERQVTKQRSG